MVTNKMAQDKKQQRTKARIQYLSPQIHAVYSTYRILEASRGHALYAHLSRLQPTPIVEKLKQKIKG